MIEKVRARPTGRVLDVGCGLGTPAIRLADATGGEVVGITVSQEQVKRARAQAAREGLADRVTFQYGDAAAMPFDAASFDAVWALESIIHMQDRGKVLQEIARVVRPGGRVVLTDFFERAPIPDHKRSAVDKFYSSWIMGPRIQIDDYPGLVRGAGLRLVELVDISEQVMRRTLLHVSERIAQNKRMLDDAFGADLVGQLNVADLADVWELGYLLLVAERPATDQ
jgi:avermectin B 5-O-methyltransferase